MMSCLTHANDFVPIGWKQYEIYVLSGTGNNYQQCSTNINYPFGTKYLESYF